MDIRMRKKVLAFYDPDRNYTERLSRYLGQRKDCIFDVRGFSDRAAFQEFVRETPVDVMLASKDGLATDIDDKSGIVFVLSENLEEKDREHNTIYKYHSSENLVREVMAAYESEKTSKEAAAADELKSEVLGIYSPVGRCYKTTFSMILSVLLSERAPTLYLNFEDYPGFQLLSSSEAYMKAAEKDSLSDILFYRKATNDLDAGRLFRAVQFAGRLAYLPPAYCPADIRNAKPEELAAVIAGFGSSELYRYVVVDMGGAMADPLPSLSLCNRIFLPGRRDRASEAKLYAFQEYLRSIGHENILEKLKPIYLPSYTKMAEGTGLRALRDSPLGRYVERHMEEFLQDVAHG